MLNCLAFLLMQKKRLDQKRKINFKIYNGTDCLTNNYSLHVAQYLTKGNQKMKLGQLIEYDKKSIFLQESCRKQAGRLAPGLFLFFKKDLDEVKANAVQLSFNAIQQPSTWHAIKINWKNFRKSTQKQAQFRFFKKGSGNSFSTTFCV